MIDHLVVVAPSLEAGAAHVRNALGVDLQPGGEHERMGTHNRLLRLGDDVYLEVIAVNPAAPRPGRARWFQLEGFRGKPFLATWIARCADIAGAPALLGEVEAMSRGSLRWLIAIPPDGVPPLQGIAPGLIQWRSSHPAPALEDRGCTLVRFEGFHPEPGRVAQCLAQIGFDGPFAVFQAEHARLVAHIETPAGMRQLD